MSTHLNLLLLEDSVNDAELMLDMLREAGFELASRRVDSKGEYLHALEQPPDFILSDFSMPQFTARDALRLLQERGLDIPFIVVSGCIGEEMAVECMRAGATDYLLKDRMGRLGHAVSQALARKRLLEEKRQAEQRLVLETYHDALTGLPNRTLFLDRLDRVYQQTRRQSSHLFALVYLNLDGFLVVHDGAPAPYNTRAGTRGVEPSGPRFPHAVFHDRAPVDPARTVAERAAAASVLWRTE
jgi:PleD family two-component response regulator